VKSERSEKSRHIVFRAEVGDVLPDALVAALREHGVTAGWMRASGVLSDIELRVYSADLGGFSEGRRIAGPAHALVLDACIGVAHGDVSLSLRGVLAREADRGMETLAGEIVTAKVVALEAIVTALDDLALPRALDHGAGIWLLADPTGTGRPSASVPEAQHSRPALERAALPAPQRQPSPPWSEAIAASAGTKDRSPAGPVRSAQGIPQRLARPEVLYEDSPIPEPGDIVDHFAFGTCEVLKSEGDRLHLKVAKDSRIREIALEMLRVTLVSIDSAPGEKRRYKLDRKI
jgi:predicted DNA-binding protein with PD1-like motif